jgi:metal-responsive CopG/Arc/MetJ family transcriptional regulator
MPEAQDRRNVARIHGSGGANRSEPIASLLRTSLQYLRLSNCLCVGLLVLVHSQTISGKHILLKTTHHRPEMTQNLLDFKNQKINCRQ